MITKSTYGNPVMLKPGTENHNIQVISLAIAKELKAFGLPQDHSQWYWNVAYKDNGKVARMDSDEYKDVTYVKLSYNKFIGMTAKKGRDREYLEYYSALTVAELGIILPATVHTQKTKKGFTAYSMIWKHKHKISTKTEANARGKMLVWLLKNELIRFRTWK